MREHNTRWIAGAGIATLLFLGAGCPLAPGQQKEVRMEEEEESLAYAIDAENQTVSNGTVVIKEVNALESVWIVIHADDAGKPGAVIGHGLVAAGTQTNISVDLDVAKLTPRVFAMLHEDKGETGVYEFPGADVPVILDGEIMMTSFTATLSAREAIMEKTTEILEKNDGSDTEAMEATPRSITLTAKRWQFEPSTITVNKGDRVKLSIKSIDVTHGFSLPDFNVSATLKPNETTMVEFTADKTGTFTFSCSVFCGEGHASMKGTLVVK